MYQKRGSIQLSTNFMVMLIISIAVFSFGIYMLTNIFNFAEEERIRLDEQTAHMIENALDRGDRVFIPRERRTISPGATGTFGMGILNVLGMSAEKDFGVLVRFSKAFDKGDNQMCYSSCGGEMNASLLSAQSSGGADGLLIKKTIVNNEKATFLIGVAVPSDADSGTYIYNVYVAYDKDGAPGIQCEDFDFGGNGATPACTIDVNELYDTQIHKLYVIVP